jgi:hypothetical protein
VVFEPNQLLKNQKSDVQFFYNFSFSAGMKSHDLSFKPFDIIAINIYYLELLRALGGMLIRWSRLHLQSLAPTNPHWACVVGYGPFSLCVTHKAGLCPNSGDINKLMMMIKYKICKGKIL